MRDGQYPGQVPDQIDLEPIRRLGWREPDLLDQPPQNLGRLEAALAGLQRLDQTRHFLMVAPGHVRVEQDRRFLSRLEDALQLVLPCIQLVHSRLDLLRRHACADGIEQLVLLLIVLFMLAPVGFELRVLLHAQFVYMVRVLFAEDCAEFRVHEPFLKGFENRAFQILTGYSAAIVAGALVPCRRAAIVGLGNKREPAATAAALEETR